MFKEDHTYIQMSVTSHSITKSTVIHTISTKKVFHFETMIDNFDTQMLKTRQHLQKPSY